MPRGVVPGEESGVSAGEGGGVVVGVGGGIVRDGVEPTFHAGDGDRLRMLS
jgi:hypothetical protein